MKTMRKLLPVGIFVSVVAAIILREIWLILPTAPHASPNSPFNNPGQIWGGPNSTFHKPGQIFADQSFWSASLIIQATITAVFVAAGVFVILSKRYAPTERHWAYGALGTILGFWLRASN